MESSLHNAFWLHNQSPSRSRPTDGHSTANLTAYVNAVPEHERDGLGVSFTSDCYRTNTLFQQNTIGATSIGSSYIESDSHGLFLSAASNSRTESTTYECHLSNYQNEYNRELCECFVSEPAFTSDIQDFQNEDNRGLATHYTPLPLQRSPNFTTELEFKHFDGSNNLPVAEAAQTNADKINLSIHVQSPMNVPPAFPGLLCAVSKETYPSQHSNSSMTYEELNLAIEQGTKFQKHLIRKRASMIIEGGDSAQPGDATDKLIWEVISSAWEKGGPCKPKDAPKKISSTRSKISDLKRAKLDPSEYIAKKNWKPKYLSKAENDPKLLACIHHCGHAWPKSKRYEWLRHYSSGRQPQHVLLCLDCKKPFFRKDKCLNHLRKSHDMSKTLAKRELKNKTKILRVNVAKFCARLGKPLPLEYRQCGFCGRKMNRWKKLYKKHVFDHLIGDENKAPCNPQDWKLPWSQQDSGIPVIDYEDQASSQANDQSIEESSSESDCENDSGSDSDSAPAGNTADGTADFESGHNDDRSGYLGKEIAGSQFESGGNHGSSQNFDYAAPGVDLPNSLGIIGSFPSPIDPARFSTSTQTPLTNDTCGQRDLWNFDRNSTMNFGNQEQPNNTGHLSILDRYLQDIQGLPAYSPRIGYSPQIGYSPRIGYASRSVFPSRIAHPPEDCMDELVAQFTELSGVLNRK